MKEEIQDPFSNALVIKQNEYKSIDYFNEGIKLLQHKDQHENAIVFLKRAIYKNSTNDDLAYRIATTLLEKSHYLHATYFFDAAIKLQPETPEVYYQYGRCLAKLAGSDVKYIQNYENALVCFNNAIKLKDDYGDAYQGRAIIYRLLGDENQARSDFKKCEKLKQLNRKKVSSRENQKVNGSRRLSF